MPVIARFDGITIIIQYDDHNPPHVHVRYAEHRATITIGEGRVGSGDLPKSIERKALHKEHKEALLSAWLRMSAHQEVRIGDEG
ncbi:MAG: DUF4160 domain-containing protein [Thermodesulfobacteriota bacterium]